MSPRSISTINFSMKSDQLKLIAKLQVGEKKYYLLPQINCNASLRKLKTPPKSPAKIMQHRFGTEMVTKLGINLRTQNPSNNLPTISLLSHNFTVPTFLIQIHS